MKYGKIMLFSGIALAVSLVMRLLQIIFTVDTSTGFFKTEYTAAGYYLMVMTAVICAATAFICFTSHRSPARPPRTNAFMSAASFLMVPAIFIELYAESFSGTVMVWQNTLLVLTGIAAAVYFTVFGFTAFADIRMPQLLAVLPAIYFIMRIICSFTSISSLALITDNIFLIAAYCVSLVFFLCFGKLYNGIVTDNSFRKLFASGTVAAILCFTQSVPHIIVNIATSNGYQHTSNAANYALLITGVFIAVFILSHFSVSNCAEESESERAEQK